MDYYNRPKYTISNTLLENYCTNYKPSKPSSNYYGSSNDYYNNIQPFYYTNRSNEQGTTSFSINSTRSVTK